MNRTFLIILLISSVLLSCKTNQKTSEIQKWGLFEIVLTGSDEGNPYMDVLLEAVFQTNDKQITVPGFYDGNGIYRIRFSPETEGEWTYETKSNVPELNGKKGNFNCIPATGENHGPLKIVNTFYLEYADGTPFYSVGTTAYQWTSVKQSIQEQTIATLKETPFNKIRMCVFPKSYRYGNDVEPWTYPYKREGEQNDFTKPNYDFFQNFDNRVQQLLDLGIQADVILFHPYDKWDYCEMGDELNKRYVRYMIARISAYRNVWWSLANEWDVPKIKETIDWEAIGTLLQNEDPHQRFRGIHNWYDTEDHFYNHSRPWITHASIQSAQFFNAIKWRNQYQKPLLLDEMRYEGDVPSGWGNLSAEEMTSYFWMAGLSGGYATHGETLKNDSDTSEVRWWAKGGTLMGESPERILFFKSIMETAPVKEMIPELQESGNPQILNNNVYLFSKPEEFYLAYVANKNETINVKLQGEKNYDLEIIDTWNMIVLDKKSINPGSFQYTTSIPFTALKIYRNNE